MSQDKILDFYSLGYFLDCELSDENPRFCILQNLIGFGEVSETKMCLHIFVRERKSKLVCAIPPPQKNPHRAFNAYEDFSIKLCYNKASIEFAIISQ